MTLTEELMTAALTAPDERKAAALRTLRGEVTEPPEKKSQGSLLLGMGAGAKFLGVSRATLWRILQAGRLEKVELFPGSFRVRRDDLESLASGVFGFTGTKSRRGRPRKDRGVAAGSVGGGQLAVDSKATLAPALAPPREREKSGKAVAA